MKPKIDRETLAQLSDLSAGAIARKLGVTRQAVYLASERFGIPLPRYHLEHTRRGSATVPVARVTTGGVQAPINHSVAGSICELLVAADLMARGWAAFMPVIASKGHDLIGVKDDLVITIEVRSAYRNAAGKLIFAKKPDCRSAHYALCVTGEPVAYEPALPS